MLFRVAPVAWVAAVTASAFVALTVPSSDATSVVSAVEPSEDATAAAATSPLKRHNEFVLLEGHQVRENYHSPLPHTYIDAKDLPVREMSDIALLECKRSQRSFVFRTTTTTTTKNRKIGIGAMSMASVTRGTR